MPVTCQFVWSAPTGTSAKFDCLLPGGEVVKVKYGRNPEIQAEIAATRLLTALGFAADHMYLVPQLRCYGCPTFPFLSMRLMHLFGASRDGEPPSSGTEQFRDFNWVAVERKFPGRSVESADVKGWAWWELARVNAPRAELDALRLIAVFLAHWDNKAENQRLVCVDAVDVNGAAGCAEPLLIVQDVGSTFGPTKVNLARWRATPVWADTATCRVSMRMMPWRGATFPDATISEEARQRVGRALASFTNDDLRRWFAAAHFPQFYSGTNDERDLTRWIEAYRVRVRQILTAGPCPD